MNAYWHKILDKAYEHWLVTGLVVVALVLFLAYSLLG
jgi:hypothetical protein